MNPILVAVDFSNTSYHAVKCAITLAKARQCAVHMITIPQYPMTIGENPMPLSMVREIDLGALAQLQTWQHNLTVAYDFKDISVSLEYGNIADAVNSKAISLNALMIVVGTVGANNTVDMFLGSVTDNIIHHTTCPVLCVPPASSEELPKRLVFATDLNEDDITCIEDTIAIADAAKCWVEVVHVDNASDTHAGEFKKHMENLAAMAKVTYQSLEAGNVENTLYGYALQIPGSWLAVNRRHHTIFTRMFDRSVSNKLLQQSNLPLLVYNVHKK